MYVAFLYVSLIAGGAFWTDTPDAPTATQTQCIEKAQKRAMQFINTDLVSIVGIKCEKLPPATDEPRPA